MCEIVRANITRNLLFAEQLVSAHTRKSSMLPLLVPYVGNPMVVIRKVFSCHDVRNDSVWLIIFANNPIHYSDVIMGAMSSQITSLTIVYSTVYSGADQRKHQSFVSLAFVPGIHRWPVNSPHKWPVTRKMFPFDDVIMTCTNNIQTDRTNY